MYSTSVLKMLMVALSATTVTRAAWLDVELFGGVHHEGAVRRQLESLSFLATDSSPSTPAAQATSPSTTEAEEPTSTSAEEEPTTTEDNTPTTTEEEPTTTEPTTTREESPTSEPPRTTNDPEPTTTNDNQPTTTDASPSTGPTSPSGPTSTGGGSADPTTTNEPTTSRTGGGGGGGEQTTTTRAPSTTLSSFTSVVTEVTVITTQDERGQDMTVSTSTTRTSTGAALVTASSDADSSSGMPDSQRNIIVGVTVGVGGAIVLGVAGLLYWRLRNKRRSGEESEDLVSYGNGFGGPGTAEKSETATNPSSRSPFQSTLESYHAPTHTNAASNF